MNNWARLAFDDCEIFDFRKKYFLAKQNTVNHILARQIDISQRQSIDQVSEVMTSNVIQYSSNGSRFRRLPQNGPCRSDESHPGIQLSRLQAECLSDEWSSYIGAP